MHDITLLLAIVMGIPLGGGILVAIIAILRSWALKSREIRLKERQFKLEQELKTAEAHARILRMDDPGINTAQLNALAEEVRMLRQEVAEIKQEISNRGG